MQLEKALSWEHRKVSQCHPSPHQGLLDLIVSVQHQSWTANFGNMFSIEGNKFIS